MITADTLFSEGGIIQGVGKVIRANGEEEYFTLTSDPLTEDQAKALNEENDNGSNTSSGS